MVGASGRLTGRELLALQLRAFRYAEPQIDLILGAAGAAAQLLASAAVRLGVRDAADAIQAAATRGLLVGPTEAAAEPRPGSHSLHTPYGRYVARWDADQQSHRIFDTVRGGWAAGQPLIPHEGAAMILAETLNQRETAREQRRWLRDEDRQRDRK